VRSVLLTPCARAQPKSPACSSRPARHSACRARPSTSCSVPGAWSCPSARHDVSNSCTKSFSQLTRPEFYCARRFPQLGFRQPPLSYPREHATVVVFVEFANALLPIRLSSLLGASLRARRVLSVVPQHSCLPLARVNDHAPARCHCGALALRPSNFTCARICRRAVEPVLPCS
jgi:hypothetical protein